MRAEKEKERAKEEKLFLLQKSARELAQMSPSHSEEAAAEVGAEAEHSSRFEELGCVFFFFVPTNRGQKKNTR